MLTPSAKENVTASRGVLILPVIGSCPATQVPDEHVLIFIVPTRGALTEPTAQLQPLEMVHIDCLASRVAQWTEAMSVTAARIALLSCIYGAVVDLSSVVVIVVF